MVYIPKNGKTTDVRRPEIAEQRLLSSKGIVDHFQAQRSLKPPAPAEQK